ncbi:MAG: Rab family GTPase [Candidatus Odinarchaeota archaeon]
MTLGQLVRPNSFKIAILGEGGIGKTTICKTYDHHKTFLDTMQTIAVEFHVIRRNFRGENYTLQVWDLGGQQHFKNMGVFGKYCKGIRGAVVCFDLTDIETLFAVPEWLAFIPDNVPMFLVGTKGDLAESDDFVIEEIKQLMATHGFVDYIETSATDLESVERVFNCLLAKLTAPVTPSVNVPELLATKNIESM